MPTNELKAKITADISGLKDGLLKAQKLQSDFSKKIKETQKAIAENISITKQYENALTALTQEYKSGAISQKQFQKQLQRIRRDESETSIETKRLRIELAKLKRDSKSVGDGFSKGLGKAKKSTSSLKGIVTGLVGTLGALEVLRFGVRFAQDAARLEREAKGVEFAFEKLGSVGVNAFEDIKKATKGTLSDLEIKRSLNEFQNLGISLKTSGVAFEFLAVRAAQTGKSIASMREDLVTGLGRGSVRILDNLGLSMADLNKLTKEQGLTIQEAFGVIASREIKKAGNILEETANNQDKFTAAYENFKLSLGDRALGSFVDRLLQTSSYFADIGTNISDASSSLTQFLANAIAYSIGLGGLVKERANLNKEENKRIRFLKEINKLQKERGLTQDQVYNAETRLSQLTTDNIQKVLASEQAMKKSILSRTKETSAIKLTVAELRKKNKLLAEEQEGLTLSDKSRSLSINKQISSNKKQIQSIIGKSETYKGKASGVELSIGAPEIISNPQDIAKTVGSYYDKITKAFKDKAFEIDGVDKEIIGSIGGVLSDTDLKPPTIDNTEFINSIMQMHEAGLVFTTALGSAFGALGGQIAGALATGNAIVDAFVGSIINSLSSLLAEFVANQLAMKILGKLQIASEQAKANAAGIVVATQGAAAFGPGAPLALPALLASTAAVINGSFAPLYAFANGGIVPGGSFNGDKVPAMVNSGEMILNSGQQGNLFKTLNGNFGNLQGKAGDNGYIAETVVRGQDMYILMKKAEKNNIRTGR